jgi:alkylation response protein AidB-like acyl-CoA dehydrogenase
MAEEKFGDLATIPFSEPSWYDPRNISPYYDENHKAWRKQVRDFVETEIMPFRDDWDKAGKIPEDLYHKAGKFGILSAVCGWPEELSPVPRPKGFDGFFTFITMDELSRCGSGGIVWGLVGGFGIGIGPLIHSGTDEMRERVAKPVISGEKKICLAISEAQAGSDVANLTTTAIEEGDFYIINGNKKWITGGLFADYAVVAARTGGKGMGGLSLILVDTKTPGFSARLMECMGVKGSGTAFIELDDVKVPKSNLIGDVSVLLRNFVGERLGIAIQANRYARVCLTESIIHCRRRKAFGKLLQDQPVIRQKLANMAKDVESVHAYLENLAYRGVIAEKRGEDWFDSILRTGAEAGLAKVLASNCFEYCAREAAMIFGGSAYVTGNRVEHLYRQVLSLAIPGGSSDVLIDSSARLALQGKL